MKLITTHVILCLTTCTGVATAEWITESVLPSGQIVDTSLSISADGSPVIAFCEEGALRVAFFVDSAWVIEDVVLGDNIKVCSLELDDRGMPEIVYWNELDYSTHYVKWNGSGWTGSMICGGEGVMAGPDCALRLDSQGNPIIAYLFHSPYGNLCIARPDDSGWLRYVIDTGVAYCTSMSMDLGSDDVPQVAYYHPVHMDLMYATGEDDSWIVQTVASEGMVGDEVSIAVDSRNLPHISYLDRTEGALMYAHFDGTDWETDTVEFTGDATGLVETCIQVNSEDLPRILYYDLGDSRLKLASYDGSSWGIEQAGDRGHSSSLVLDSNDQARIAYFRYSYSNWSLMYAYADQME
jgi:hypothetical protein